MRKFKHLGHYLGIFVAGAVQNFHLEHDRGKRISKFRLLAIEGDLIDLIIDSHIEQSVLLSGNHGFLTLEFGPLGASVSLSVLVF